VAELALRGVVTSGLGKAAGFTEIDWVREQFAQKLPFAAWPGTLNVRLLDDESLAQWRMLSAQPGIEIEPPGRSACVARCYEVLVAETVPGAIILPHVADYPSDQIEVLAATNLRRELGLADGDPVTLRVREAAS
jgi:riboflavin kinase, archaea type